jgi:hypothetical protein
MRRKCLAVLVTLAWALSTRTVLSFCGFYVAKADSKLFNKASRVAIAREGDETVLTMANDFQGEPRDFAVVIPVPTFIERKAIQVLDMALLDHIDAYSAPRLVEYFDEDPCRPPIRVMSAGAPQPAPGGATAKKRGVTIEAQYTVGEYDIVILSATESSGLETWLGQNGYRIPSGAASVLGGYIKQNMRFFVARVNLKEQAKLGFSYLRPIQVAYESPKFMLPIRLGMVNADGPQELFVYALTRKGRVEATNYRTVKLPTGMDLPVFVKQEFSPFYKAMFSEQVRRENMSTIFVEYAWDMAWCDPCAADPLSRDELQSLGVFWLDQGSPAARPQLPRPLPFAQRPASQSVFMTRLHVRYDNAHFPEDLVFQETADRENFQGRYVLRHPWKGTGQCSEAELYQKDLGRRQEREAETLASLTGWRIDEIRKKANIAPAARPVTPVKWWRQIWK